MKIILSKNGKTGMTVTHFTSLNQSILYFDNIDWCWTTDPLVELPKGYLDCKRSKLRPLYTSNYFWVCLYIIILNANMQDSG